VTVGFLLGREQSVTVARGQRLRTSALDFMH
jgi:hypothetical protein